MSILCTVRILCPIERVREIENANPDVMGTIGAAAKKYSSGHRRFERNGEVLDLDEFPSQEDLDRFMAEAGDAIQSYDDLIGTPTEQTVYRVVED